MEKLYQKKLMEDYNTIKRIPEEDYLPVFRKLIFRKLPRNHILKQSNKIDDRSRYICEGFVGLYEVEDNRDKLHLIFGPTDTAFDPESFKKETASRSIIKTLSPTYLFEFTEESEQLLLTQSPGFIELAHEVNIRIRERHIHQLKIKNLKFTEGYPKLIEIFPRIQQHIKNQELADFFSISLSSVERHKSQIFKNLSDE